MLRLTKRNYYSEEANREYWSASFVKAMLRCPAAAMAAEPEEPSTAILVGSYVDAYFEGTLDCFREDHPELFKRDGTLKADYLQAEEDHEALLSRIRFASAPVPLSEIRWPVYLSIDLDVLAPEEIMTSWDQGTLSLERLLADIESLRQHGALLGTDICGGPAPAQRQTPDGPVQLTRCYEVYARIVQALRA